MVCFSKALSGVERNYVACELELYSIVRAVEHFRLFLLGRVLFLNVHATFEIFYASIFARPPGSNFGSCAIPNIP